MKGIWAGERIFQGLARWRQTLDDEKEAIEKEKCMSCQYLYIEDLYLFDTNRLCRTRCTENSVNKEEKEDENT